MSHNLLRISTLTPHFTFFTFKDKNQIKNQNMNKINLNLK